ncbi:sigma-70 family RNA polymerase sigma factor [Flaviramulus aquimarinus]|uniref:Sigma-70 family RNA polymerase sigma factor n=1 Tax=Flaviramulus aquimarinus TaxID=1170456 RepID=A0ABP9EQG1_9FLAO
MDKKQRSIDRKLVLDYQSGDHKALALLVRRWHKLFCEKAFWIVKDADVAKDIAQDSWSTIINKIDRLKDPNSFGSWALRIVYNKSLDTIKAAKRRQQTVEAHKYTQDEILTEEKTNDTPLKNALLKTIKTLPENQQVVIRLFYVQDYSLKEISGILNISVGTTKSRLFHAREKLKQILKHQDYEMSR